MTTDQHCPAEATCSTQPVWHTLKKDIYQLLAQKTLADMTTPV
jgi:DNA-binding IscR family transcriptional regulator